MIDCIPNWPLYFSQKDIIETILAIINHIMNHCFTTIDHILTIINHHPSFLKHHFRLISPIQTAINHYLAIIVI